MVRVAAGRHAPPQRGCSVEMLHVSKRFGAFAALDDVCVSVRAGSFHALLGENGAGKSTLVKCLVGYYRPDDGQILVDGHEREIRTPQHAHAAGIGMVYQHFTLVPSMTAAENLVMARDDVPAVIDWRRERERIAAFMQQVPFKLRLDEPVSALAAGEKQKLEILKQLYLRRRFMILDEPTSVLTPQEADEVLGLLRGMVGEGALTILMITHKFREVMRFADRVSVLRRGKLAGEGQVVDLNPSALAEMMIGARHNPQVQARRVSAGAAHPVRLSVSGLCVHGDSGNPAVRGADLSVRGGEIVGIAGVSGNGQRELVEALIGQRRRAAGEVAVNGTPYRASRGEIHRHKVFSLPEEPLRNACVGPMSVSDNMALRNFDRPPNAFARLLRRGRMRSQSRRLIDEYKVKAPGPDAPIRTLSGGNVQRAVLARELSGDVSVLIVANPVFGLDFAAVAEIHARLLAARDAGAAVLLVSEDLDELLKLSDRILVMFDGTIVHETSIGHADVPTIGAWMAGHGHTGMAAA